MPYYVMKTGLPMFDACRAYGLAMVIERLAQATDAVADVTITDMGPLYLIDGPSSDELATVKPEGLLDDLFALTDGWCGAFLTTGRATKAERLKPASRSNIEERLQSVRQQIVDLGSWINQIGQMLPVELKSTSGEGFESLPASLDVSASKGIRRAKRDGYSEGEQLYVPIAHWAIGLLGSAHFIRWAWAGNDYAGLLATPRFVTMRNHRDIKAITDTTYLASVSTSTVAGHYAVQMSNTLCRKKADPSTYADCYDVLVVQTMTYSGQQWKANSGVIFPLEYPMRLIDSSLPIAAEVFSLWDRVFRWGSIKGNETLALTLAEFLGQPNLETFERHARVHLKMTILDDKQRPFPPYQEDWIKEVLRYV